MNQQGTAAELSERLEWLNASPQRIDALRGRVVVLAFWHAGSVVCGNLMRGLQAVQNKHASALVVIGIHCPKFDAERDRACVEAALQRLNLRYPVAADPDFVTWQHYAIQGWPCCVVIDTHGHMRQQFAGDLCLPELDALVDELLLEPDDSTQPQSMLTPLPVMPTPTVRASGQQLAFPSGLAFAENRLYIADSGHHRVLECTLDGHIVRRFGSGNPSLLDGSIHDAGFQFPCGLALHKDSLFVADRDNHALRRIRLLEGDVETIHGNGKPGMPGERFVDLDANGSMNAPSAVVATAERLFIAVRGVHQIWVYDLLKRRMQVLAGSGQPGLGDGLGGSVRFTEPAALAQVQQTLYVADSGNSALRSLNINDGSVHTLLGKGPFEFGDQDGTRSSALLQHPLALVVDTTAACLWVADAYNHAIKQLRLGGNQVSRQALDGELRRPAALAVHRGQLWIANSDAHELLNFDPGTGQLRRVVIGE